MTKNRLKILKIAASGRCPNCENKSLFKTKYHLHESCPNCGLPLESEDGWSYGAVPMNYSLTCIAWIFPIGLLFLFGFISIKVALIAAILGAIAIPPLTYRYSKCVWVGLYYAVLREEICEKSEEED